MPKYLPFYLGSKMNVNNQIHLKRSPRLLSEKMSIQIKILLYEHMNCSTEENTHWENFGIIWHICCFGMEQKEKAQCCLGGILRNGFTELCRQCWFSDDLLLSQRQNRSLHINNSLWSLFKHVIPQENKKKRFSIIKRATMALRCGIILTSKLLMTLKRELFFNPEVNFGILMPLLKILDLASFTLRLSLFYLHIS